MAEDSDRIDLDAPLRIRHLKVFGTSRTNVQVLEDELQRAYKAKTAGQVFDGVLGATKSLKDMGIFEKIDVKLDTAQGGRIDETDLLITVKEKSLLELKFSTETTAGQTARPEDGLRAETSVRLTNPFGGGERLTGTTAYTAAGSRESGLKYFVPRIFGFDLNFSLEGSQDFVDKLRISSYTEILRALNGTIRSYNGVHLISGEMMFRDIVPRRHPSIPFARASSLEILSLSSPSIKASIKHTYTKDYRDDPFVPTSGSFLQVTNELAGPPGTVSFLKSTGSVQKHFRLADLASVFNVKKELPISLGLCFGFGAIRPLGNSEEKKSACLSDRYFLGGPLHMRGFKVGGMGPRSTFGSGGNKEGDSLGGEIQATMSAHLSAPFPNLKVARLGARCFLFANSGVLSSWQTPLTEISRDARLSVGYGFIVPVFSSARLELTHSHIIRKAYNDQIQRLQLGLGVSFF